MGMCLGFFWDLNESPFVATQGKRLALRWHSGQANHLRATGPSAGILGLRDYGCYKTRL
jgi:hypothetical protein